MVLKKSRYDYNRGSTFCRLCRNKNAKETGKIYKFMSGNGHDEDKQIKVIETLEQYLQDGGMQNNRNFYIASETYSLNKRKRWTLPTRIIEAIDSEELEDLDFRLVMHERSGVPFRHGWIDPDSEIKASTLSYHDSKYTLHHMYPNSKSRVSSLTDLKLNCHLKHGAPKSDPTSARGSSRRSRKCHTRGIQRKIPPPDPDHNYYWRRNAYFFRDVMEATFHHVKVPEVRYEIHYPDVFNRYCKCPKYRGHSRYFPGNTKKEIKRWKTKNGRSKPRAQKNFRGIDSIEKRMYASCYTTELELDVDISDTDTKNDNMIKTEKDVDVQRRSVTFGDFFVTMNESSKYKQNFKSSSNKRKTNACLQTKHNALTETHIGQNNRKSNVIYIDTPVNVQKECSHQQHSVPSMDDVGDDVTSSVFGEHAMAELSWSDFDFESQYCQCTIDKESVQDMIVSSSDYDVQVSNCVPQQVCITIKGETHCALVILWQRSGWSPSSDQAKYWAKVQFECNGTVTEMSTEDLKSKLTEEKGTTLSLNQIIATVEKEAANRTVEFRRHGGGDSALPNGHLTTTIAHPSYDVKTVHEAYQTLLTEKEDILQSFELVNMVPISSESGVCETCLSGSDDPRADGCTILPCQHYFCIYCWRSHITIKIKEGTVDIPCQAFKCKEYIDDVMIHTVASCDLINKWMNRKKERMLESSHHWHWCPSVSCDRVVRVTSVSGRFTDDNFPILCVCDRTWCFACQYDIHWPATCEQYSIYRKQLAQNGHTDGGGYPAEPPVYYVDVKKCPNCNHPIEKNGGCPQMICRCSHSFCWECLRDRASHVDGVECKDLTTRLITMSLDDTTSLKMHTRLYKKCVVHRYKWKRTFSNRAIEQRVKFFENSISYKMKNLRTNSKETIGPSAILDLRSSFDFIREVHVLLENIYVMLSHTTRRIHRYRGLLEHIEFCTSRMEHILDQPSLCKDDVRRAYGLRTSVGRSLRILPHLASFIQSAIQRANARGINPHTKDVC
ncbi:uncharacterized protein LOC117331858 [Pecten maximus]|uniref:uncharacterized protein LOC117331858 n=1 Tax=Pecten maximus TaxID=6579 RepID=UPI001458337C|nr:uncharacterized protein LOC117331858 [Pecten maximus]